ncbi:MAG: MFS transporter [Halieaceae bacterium]|nr:MFS transporter [Halieaceae bacterium]
MLAKTPYTSQERRAVLGLAVLYSLRMVGLFMVLPLLGVYAADLAGATPSNVGLALGAYGLTQALLQTPLGWLSDRIGRKPVILGGLAVFIAGSAVAALADSIGGVIAGRFLQGGGAVAAALMALAADYTREDQRTKTMAIIGASIGGAFVLSLIVGPLIAAVGGLSLVFWVTAGLGIFGVLLVQFGLPKPPQLTEAGHQHGLQPGRVRAVAAGHGLPPLYLSIFLLHAMLMSVFLVIPGRLNDVIGLPADHHWAVYLGAVVLSLPGTLMLLRQRRASEVPRWALAIALACLLLGMALAFVANDLWWLGGGVALFFLGFNTLEASLPSLVSLRAPGTDRGTAMGLFSTGQFLGAFLGGWAGGLALAAFGPAGLAQGWLVLVALWAVLLVRGPDLSPEATTISD